MQGVDSQFTCLNCLGHMADPTKAVFSKNSAFTHLTKKHLLDDDLVKGFIVVSDSNKLKSHRAYNMLLRVTLEQAAKDDNGPADVAPIADSGIDTTSNICTSIEDFERKSHPALETAFTAVSTLLIDFMHRKESFQNAVTSIATILKDVPLAPTTDEDDGEEEGGEEDEQEDHPIASSSSATFVPQQGQQCSAIVPASTSSAIVPAANGSIDDQAQAGFTPAFQAAFVSLAGGIHQMAGDLRRVVEDRITEPNEMKLPVVKLSGVADGWKVPYTEGVGPTGKKILVPPLRMQCPLPVAKIELQGNFGAFLSSVGCESIAKNQNVAAVKRFFSAIEVSEFEGPGFKDQQDWEHIQVFMAISQTSIMNELQLLPCMHPYRTWSAKIVAALKHYVDHLKVMALGDHSKWSAKDIGLLNLLRESQLKFWGKKAKKGAKIARLAKNFLTSQQLSNFPSVEVMQFAVEQAMLILNAVVEAALARGSITNGELALLNKCICLILACNGFLGRSGEWKRLLASIIEALNRSGCGVVICEEHKTSANYGELAKFLFPGTVIACARYVEIIKLLPNPKLCKRTGEPLFLQPVGGDACGDFPFHSYLKHASILFIKPLQQKSCLLTVNLLRKMFHSEVMDLSNADKALFLIGKADAHGIQTAKSHYVVSNPDKDSLEL